MTVRQLTERAVLLAAVFLFGLSFGVVSRGGTTRVEGTSSIVRVAGEDRNAKVGAAKADSAVSPATSAQAVRKRSSSIVPPVAERTEKHPVDARDVAEGALEFTAFIRNGSTYGAGVLLDDRGHVLTCHHVIEGAGVISVSFLDSGRVTAEVVEVDRELDLALLKIPTQRLGKARFASVASISMGDDVFAMGAPRKLRFSMSRGLVSFVGRPFGKLYYLQTDLPTNGGNSGGPVMNDRGEVVGISSFIYRDTQGLSFALPIDYALKRFANHLSGVALDGSSFAEWERTVKKRGFLD